MQEINELEQRIRAIEERNRRVEQDKAWETSWARRLAVTSITYALIVLFFFIANLPKPWLNSIVPALAFVLSTAGLGVLKRFWLRARK
ncbi:MAG: hypothetical protein Q8Q20_01475 [bacterium]|nr:hypothetical protein [bacterium]